MIKQRENIITTLSKSDKDLLESSCIEDIYTRISIHLLKCMNCPYWGECDSNKILRNTRFDIEKYVIEIEIKERSKK